MSEPDSESVITETRHWIKSFVIGLNLCPFAAQPFANEKIRYQVCDATGEEDIWQALLSEMEQFNQLAKEEVETGLLVLSRGLRNFSDYLDFLARAEEALEAAGLEGLLQLASFHPDYCFEGVPEDDPANKTNRSPYPMFHFIREDVLETALASYPDADKIPERNVRLLRDMFKL